MTLGLLARRIFAFGSLPLIASIAPLFLLPLIARSGGPQGWVSILGAQAIGSIAQNVVMWGWSLEGQAQIARADPLSRAEIYRMSLQMRMKIAPLVLPPGIVLVHLTVARGLPLAGDLMFVATAMSGFSLAWFATGSGQALWVAKYELAPKILATGAAAFLIVITHELWTYPLLLVCSTVAGLISFHRRVFGVVWPIGRLIPPVRSARTWPAAMASIQGNLYGSAPVPIASIVAGSGVAGLASADKAFRLGMLSITALSQALQAWVLDPRANSVWRRSWIALALHTILGCGGGLLMLVGLPPATKLLFGQEVAATHEVAVGYAVAFLALNLSTPLNANLLIPFGRIRVVTIATMLCLAVGIPMMFVLGSSHGVSGVSFAFALSEVTMAALAAITSIRAWTELPR